MSETKSVAWSAEPIITVNGIGLSEGQAMTVRVALTSFFSELGEPDALGPDEHGRRMTKEYRTRAEEVIRLMTGEMLSEEA